MSAYSVDIQQDENVIIFKVDRMPVTHSSSDLLDNIISFHHIVVAYRCTNSKLLRRSSISDLQHCVGGMDYHSSD